MGKGSSTPLPVEKDKIIVVNWAIANAKDGRFSDLADVDDRDANDAWMRIISSSDALNLQIDEWLQGFVAGMNRAGAEFGPRTKQKENANAT